MKETWTVSVFVLVTIKQVLVYKKEMSMKKIICLLLFFLPSILFARTMRIADPSPQVPRADVVIFSYDRPLQLYAMLESLYKHTTDTNSISVVYRTSDDRFDNAFHLVAEQFPDVLFLHQQSSHDFKELTVQALEQSQSEYIVFAVDDNIVKDSISLSECINWLEKTNAYGFYLKLGTHLDYCYTENKPQLVPPHQHIDGSIYSWKFEEGEKDWNYPNTVDMTLYRKKDILALFHSLPYTNPNTLESKWASWWVEHGAPSNFGLFYAHSKILNIPLNKVQTVYVDNRDMNLYTPQELLEKFEAGYKMDINPLYKMANKAVHTEYEPTFIPRKQKTKKNIGLCIVATGKYIDFVRALLDSAEQYFCPKHSKTYFIFTDSTSHNLKETPYKDNVIIVPQKRLGWPYDTLMRAAMYHEHRHLFADTDYMFATDADMLFVGYEGDEILQERIGTQHPGFEKNKPLWGSEPPYDRNPLSLAYIPYDQGIYYFAGGFYGGSTAEFINMISVFTKNILTDLEEQNYIAIWHDESHLNRYFVTHPPTVLDRSYCYPENGIDKGYPPCSPKLLALDKNHSEMRE
jgi:histo-blood group ABO system transferase